MPLALDQADVEAPAAPPAEQEDEESAAARLAALGLVAGGAAAAAGAGVAEAAGRVLDRDAVEEAAPTEPVLDAESEAPARILDFRPSPAPQAPEAPSTAPWPDADLGTAARDADLAPAVDLAPTADAAPVEAEVEAEVEAAPAEEAPAAGLLAGEEPTAEPVIAPLPATVVAATVDVGGNSAHLLVAAVTGHHVEPIYDESAFLGLGDRVATHGFLGAEARDELVATLSGYADAARSLGATSVTFMGTEPVRRAADAGPLVQAVEGRANAPLVVLDHDEEAKLTLLGVTGGRPIDSDLFVIDIGGSSSEYVLVGPDRPILAGGIRIGSAVLTKEHSKSDPPTLKEIEAMRQAAKAAFASAPDARPADVVAVGGTAENLLKLLPATAVDRMLTRRRITVALAMLTVQRSAEAAERHALRPQRARVLPAGALIVDAILERYGVERLRVCNEGIREGAVIAAAKAGTEWRDRLSSLVAGWEDGSSPN
jgi:exopolyphosphatase/guanosine-5'-triphosphate,3'-diphosphate pyrophosphatase